jgi:hypothetical protein
MTDDSPFPPMLATWTSGVAANVDGRRCRHCGTIFADGDSVYLKLDRGRKLIIPYCCLEHFNLWTPVDADPG